MAKIERQGDFVKFECPGCGRTKMVPFRGEHVLLWDWNHDTEKPTISPSVLSRWDEGEERTKHCCHLNVTAGAIQFHGDCTHALKGKTVEMREVS